MQCKFHPGMRAEQICNTCGAPLCSECAEEVRPGEYTCFQCAMLQSVSQVGTTLAEKRGKATKKKKKWGPFQYFVLVSSMLIAVMWGVILFGGQPAPAARVDLAKKGRVLLFLVDSAVKRYAHYEGRKYPESLRDLVPKYLAFKGPELAYLDLLNYVRDPFKGYRLSLKHPKKEEMHLVLTAEGIEYSSPVPGGAQ